MKKREEECDDEYELESRAASLLVEALWRVILRGGGGVETAIACFAESVTNIAWFHPSNRGTKQRVRPSCGWTATRSLLDAALVWRHVVARASMETTTKMHVKDRPSDDDNLRRSTKDETQWQQCRKKVLGTDQDDSHHHDDREKTTKDDDGWKEVLEDVLPSRGRGWTREERHRCIRHARALYDAAVVAPSSSVEGWLRTILRAIAHVLLAQRRQTLSSTNATATHPHFQDYVPILANAFPHRRDWIGTTATTDPQRRRQRRSSSQDDEVVANLKAIGILSFIYINEDDYDDDNDDDWQNTHNDDDDIDDNNPKDDHHPHYCCGRFPFDAWSSLRAVAARTTMTTEVSPSRRPLPFVPLVAESPPPPPPSTSYLVRRGCGPANDRLVRDVLRHIFSFLSHRPLARACATCRAWREAGHRFNPLWRTVYERRFSTNHTSRGTPSRTRTLEDVLYHNRHSDDDNDNDDRRVGRRWCQRHNVLRKFLTIDEHTPIDWSAVRHVLRRDYLRVDDPDNATSKGAAAAEGCWWRRAFVERRRVEAKANMLRSEPRRRQLRRQQLVLRRSTTNILHNSST